jgi:hypothetical protein
MERIVKSFDHGTFEEGEDVLSVRVVPGESSNALLEESLYLAVVCPL